MVEKLGVRKVVEPVEQKTNNNQTCYSRTELH